MTLNDVPENRAEFDKAEQALLADRHELLLRWLGPRTTGLLVWHFGAGGENRSPREMPAEKIQEFVQNYA